MTQVVVHDGIAFGPLSQQKAAATLFSAGDLRFPSGELTGPWQTAWLRGVLIALFGDSPDPDPDKTTFEYRLEATVDGTREVRFVIADFKSNVGGAFGRFGVDVPDAALFARVKESLLDFCETTKPADYESKFYEYATQRYGCAKGVPWVGTKKNGAWSCQPRPGSPFFDHATMRHVFVLDVPGLSSPPVKHAVSDAEVEAYYAKHASAGMPPLASIREHVVRAIVAERTAASASELSLPFESRAIARAIFDLGDLALYDFVPLVERALPARCSEAEFVRLRLRLDVLEMRRRVLVEIDELIPRDGVPITETVDITLQPRSSTRNRLNWNR